MHAGRCGDDVREGDEAGGAGGVFVYAQEREGGALYSIRRGGAGLGDGSEDVIVSGNTLLQANALRIPLADESVHMVCTSPPYWGLRDYGTARWEGGEAECDHNPQRPDGGERADRTLPLGRGGLYHTTCGKCGAVRIDAQLGLEATIDEYVASMVAVFREVKRVLRDDGVVFLNLGDSYAGGSRDPNPNGKQGTNRGTVEFDPGHFKGFVPNGLKPKDLCGVPWRVAFALQADGWYLRSDCIWAKPNPMPESVTDRPTKSHEYIFLLTKAANYFYDADAVREEYAPASLPRALRGVSEGNKWSDGAPGSTAHAISQARPNAKLSGSGQAFGGDGHSGYVDANGRLLINPSGRNLRTVWTIATAPYSGAHFATFPPALVERCIRAGTSERGACPVCGKQWERVVETNKYHRSELSKDDPRYRPRRYESAFERYNQLNPKIGDRGAGYIVNTTLGWRPTCDHDNDPIPATVFDPFVGSGTTVAVAQQLGRRGVGIDLSLPYLHLARERTGAAAWSEWMNGKKNGKENSLEDLPMFQVRE